MSKQNDREEERRLALHGAKIERALMTVKIEALDRLFPELTKADASLKPPSRRKKPNMTKVQREAVSKRMKKYWAARRKAEKEPKKA